jgi:hypothetical protein
MTNTDMQQDEEASRRQYLRDTFGDDVFAGLATDEAKANTSARQHAARRAASDQRQHHQENLAQLRADERHQGDERAHDEAMRRISAGLDLSPALAERAIRFSRSQGGLGLSTAERLSASTLARLRREAPPDDGTRRS